MTKAASDLAPSGSVAWDISSKYDSSVGGMGKVAEAIPGTTNSNPSLMDEVRSILSSPTKAAKSSTTDVSSTSFAEIAIETKSPSLNESMQSGPSREIPGALLFGACSITNGNAVGCTSTDSFSEFEVIGFSVGCVGGAIDELVSSPRD